MNALWEKLKSSALLQSVLIAGLCLVVYWLGPISTWEVNDDVYYNLLYAGKQFTSAPNAHVLIINYVLSAIFVALYTLIPTVPWYGLFNVASIVLSVFFLNYFYAMARNNDKLVMRTAISLTCAPPFLFYLQFTKTALVLGLTGYLGLYLLSEINTVRSRLQSIFFHVVVIVFLVLSYSLRQESFYLVTILCGILIVSSLLKRNKAQIISLSATALIIILFANVHQQIYSVGWEGSKAIEQMLNYDQFHYDENKKIYDEAGLSRNDYLFLMSWGYIDEKVYSAERLDYIYNHAKKKAIKTSVYSALESAVSFPAKNYVLVLTVLVLLALLIYRQKYSVLCGCVLLTFLLCVGVLAWQGRFPPRVSTAMAYALPWIVLVLCGELRNRLYAALIAAVTLVAVALPVYGQYQDLTAVAQFRLAQNQELHQLGERVSRKPIVLAVLGASFPYEGILPFESPDYLSGAKIIGINSMNHFPVQKKQLADNGIKDIFVTMMADDSTLIALHPSQVKILKRYIYEHYQKNVDVSPVYIKRNFMLYQLRLTPDPA